MTDEVPCNQNSSEISNPTYASVPSSQESLSDHSITKKRRAEEAYYRKQTKELKKILQGLKHGFNLRPKEIEFKIDEVPSRFYLQFLLALQVMV